MKKKQMAKNALLTIMMFILTTFSSWGGNTSGVETVSCGGSSTYTLGSGCIGTWSVNLPDGTFYTATAHSIIVDWGTTTGAGSVFVVIDCGGAGTTTDAFSVNVVAPRLSRPMLLAPEHVCNDETFTMGVTPLEGATSYTYTVPPGWQINGVAVTSLTTVETSVDVTPPMYGTGSGLVKVRGNGGVCLMDSYFAVRSVLYGAHSPSLSGPLSAESGDFVTFVATNYPYTDIEWTYPDAWFFATPDNHLLHAMVNEPLGTYPVTFNANLCGVPVSAFRTITIHERESPDGGGIVPGFSRGAMSNGSGEMTTNVSIMAYPNPSQGVFDLVLENNELPYEINIYDQLGQVVYHSEESTPQITLDIQHLPKGVYILHASNGVFNQTIKISLAD